MKFRRHHNNKGSRKIRRGKTYDEVKRMAQRLGLPFGLAPASERVKVEQNLGAESHRALGSGQTKVVSTLSVAGSSPVRRKPVTQRRITATPSPGWGPPSRESLAESHAQLDNDDATPASSHS